MPDPLADLAELFDLDYGGYADDLPFYEALARRAEGPVLELGCGSGRVAVALARAGSEVWGIDIDEALLARGRGAGEDVASRLRLERADMRDFSLGRAFDLIYAAMGTFHHVLSPADQAACLRCVHEHLTPGGLFVCDLRPALHAGWEPIESTPLLHEWTRALPRTGETVLKLRAVRADAASQVQHETHVYDVVAADGSVRRLVTSVDLRFTTRYEMEELLRGAGLVLDQLYGDYDLGPFEATSDLMITVARRPAGERR